LRYPSEDAIPARQPVSIAKPALKIKLEEAATITPPARVANIRIYISSFPIIIRLMKTAINALPEIA
jgi:hypothetical protein